MRKEKREVFVAVDGTVFVDENECLEHERTARQNMLYNLAGSWIDWGDDGEYKYDLDDVVKFILVRFPEIQSIVTGDL